MITFIILLVFFPFVLLLLPFAGFAQDNYVVEVGAFAEKVDLSYFKNMSDVYEVFDQNEIYRYWVDASTKESATSIQNLAIEKGFKHARIIDIQEVREQCNALCGYVPPKKTGERKSNNPYKFGDNPLPNTDPRRDLDIERASQLTWEKRRRLLEMDSALFYRMDGNGGLEITDAARSAWDKYEQDLKKGKGEIFTWEKRRRLLEMDSALVYKMGENGELEITDAARDAWGKYENELKMGKGVHFRWTKDEVRCIFFDYDSYQLREESQGNLNNLAQILKENPNYKVRIMAHTDSRGDENYNMKLSNKRATETRKYLNKKGIKSNRILSKVYGETQPIALNETVDGQDIEQGRKYNRRVEFQILDKKGKEVGIVARIIVPTELKNRNKR